MTCCELLACTGRTAPDVRIGMSSAAREGSSSCATLCDIHILLIFGILMFKDPMLWATDSAEEVTRNQTLQKQNQQAFPPPPLPKPAAFLPLHATWTRVLRS